MLFIQRRRKGSSLRLLRHGCFLISPIFLLPFCFLLHVLTGQRLVPACSLSHTQTAGIRSQLSQHCKPFPRDKNGRGQSTQIKMGSSVVTHLFTQNYHHRAGDYGGSDHHIADCHSGSVSSHIDHLKPTEDESHGTNLNKGGVLCVPAYP